MLRNVVLATDEQQRRRQHSRMPIADVKTAFNWPAAELSTTKDATKTMPFVVAVNAQIFCFIVAHRVSSSDRNGRLWWVIFVAKKDDLNQML